jgi:uncharacterized protein (DUF433 family)
MAEFRTLDIPTVAQRPIYTLDEAARYARTTPSTATRWVRGYSYDTLRGRRWSQGVTGHEQTEKLLSFADLVELAVVAAARRAGVTMKDLRTALQTADEFYGLERPMLLEMFKVAGRHIFIVEGEGESAMVVNLSKRGQTAWRYVQDVLQSLDYEHEIARRYFPAGKDHPILIDPRVDFGQPYIVAKGVRTQMIAARFAANESLDTIADDLDVSRFEAEEALRFEGVWPALAA